MNTIRIAVLAAAVAFAGAAEVEAQRRHARRQRCPHQRSHNVVVHVAAHPRVRMTDDDAGERAVAFRHVQQTFEREVAAGDAQLPARHHVHGSSSGFLTSW